MSDAEAIGWPTTPEDLVAQQAELAEVARSQEPWRGDAERIGACFVCFERGHPGPGTAGDLGWSAAALVTPGDKPQTVVIRGRAAAAYQPGLLALREGPMLEATLRALPGTPDLLVVNATGRDHPRGAGLAIHLGARLGLPSIGVTDRPLVAAGEAPEDPRGATSPLSLAGEIVASWVRTRRGTRPLVAHPGWRTDVDLAVALLMRLTGRWRSPEPLRLARQAARMARAEDALRSEPG